MAPPALGLRAPRSAFAVLAIAALGAAVLHAVAGHGFPVPWSDEIDFLTPAVSLARHGSLNAPQLGAAHGMFWMSDLYYFLLAPVLRVFPATVDVARSVSFVAVVAAAAGFWTAARRFGAGSTISALAVALWLVSPRVVLAGNIARHEALLLAFLAWSLAGTASQHRVAAASLAGFAAVLHPAGFAFAIIVLAANLRRRGRRTDLWEWAIGVALAGFVVFELWHFGGNLSLAVDQLRFQATRKASRGSSVPAPFIGLAVLAAAVAVIRYRASSRAPTVLFAGVAVAAVAVAQIGQEMWYQVYGLETAALCLVLAVLAFVATQPAPGRARTSGAAVAAMAFLLLGVAGFQQPFYGMRFARHSQEWDAFVVSVRGELVAFDRSSPAPKTVVINSLSGLPWPAEADTVGDLRFVKETLVTEAPAGTRYELFARTLCCDGEREPTPAGRVLAHVTSTNKTFDATLIELAADPGKRAAVAR